MKAKARAMGVDMLLIDTGKDLVAANGISWTTNVLESGDLHDGAGLSDVTTVDGGVDGSASNIVFENVDYDLLTIGTYFVSVLIPIRIRR